MRKIRGIRKKFKFSKVSPREFSFLFVYRNSLCVTRSARETEKQLHEVERELDGRDASQRAERDAHQAEMAGLRRQHAEELAKLKESMNAQTSMYTKAIDIMSAQLERMRTDNERAPAPSDSVGNVANASTATGKTQTLPAGTHKVSSHTCSVAS